MNIFLSHEQACEIVLIRKFISYLQDKIGSLEYVFYVRNFLFYFYYFL